VGLYQELPAQRHVTGNFSSAKCFHSRQTQTRQESLRKSPPGKDSKEWQIPDYFRFIEWHKVAGHFAITENITLRHGQHIVIETQQPPNTRIPYDQTVGQCFETRSCKRLLGKLRMSA